MKEITMKDVMDALNSVYTDTELTHKDVVILAEAVMPLIERLQTDYKLLEALKEQLLEENEELTKKLRRHQKFVKKIQGRFIEEEIG